MRRDLRFIAGQVGARRVTVTIAGCAVIGALIAATSEATRQRRAKW